MNPALRDLSWTLSHNLMMYRHQHNLSQKRFARKCDIGEESYRLVESGQNVPRIETLLKISAMMGIKWTDLFVDQYRHGVIGEE